MKRFFPNNLEQVESMAMFYASRYEVSRKRLTDYLRRKFETTPDLDSWIQLAVAKCEKAKAVQDDRVRNMMTEQLRRRGKSNTAIRQKLKSWGLEPEKENETFTADDELRRLLDWIQKFRNRNVPDQKIIQRLASRGFQPSLIFKALKLGAAKDENGQHPIDESED